MDHKNDLEKMYAEYYTGEGGHCRYFDECKKGIDEPCKFASDKAMVGEKYGIDSSVPKIVFIGLEGLDKDESRLDTVYRTVKNITNPNPKVYNPHYKGVRYVLAYLLKGIAGESQPKNALKATLKDLNETTKHFTLLNCYKCAFTNKSQGLPHTDSMKERCQEILFREIKILKPDIVVFQAKNNRPKDFENNLHSKFGSESQIIQISGNDKDTKTAAYFYYPQSDRPLIWIWTYHGSSDPDPNKRAWVNDNKNGNVYINQQLKPVLDKAIEAFKKSRR